MQRCSRKIKKIRARQIFDSRGLPTLECSVTLECGITGVAAVPSGASTGKHEAHELRDGGESFGGKSVTMAVEYVNTELDGLLHGADVSRQYDIDYKMIECDGTKNKSRLGANAILGASLAAARAAALSYGLPLYEYIGGKNACVLPIPLVNILNGGAHAANNLDIQEFMIFPHGAKNFSHAMRMSSEIFFALKAILKEDDLSTSVGDEGGFAPNLASDEEALTYIVRSIERAGYEVGREVALALDVAAADWAKGSSYHLPKSKRVYKRDALIDYFLGLAEKFPIVSIEDPLGEEDWKGFAALTTQSKGRQIVGDDLFVTNPERIKYGIEQNCCNAVLIKPNQIGTLSETLEAIRIAKDNGYKTIISHRSGDTEDSFIADLAVATNSGQIKTGAPCRSERVCKYNRLLLIEKQLGKRGVYGLK